MTRYIEMRLRSMIISDRPKPIKNPNIFKKSLKACSTYSDRI